LSVAMAPLLFHRKKKGSGFDRFSRLWKKTDNFSALWGLDFILHLHGFKNENSLASLDAKKDSLEAEMLSLNQKLTQGKADLASTSSTIRAFRIMPRLLFCQRTAQRVKPSSSASASRITPWFLIRTCITTSDLGFP